MHDLVNGEPYKRTRIAIIDSGLAHPPSQHVPREVEDNLHRFVECKSFEPSEKWFEDDDGHGTATAMLALKVCPNAEIMILRVMQRADGGISDEKVQKAISHAVDHAADIISISLGWPYDSDQLESALKHAQDHNILVFAATSNDGNTGKGILYPASALNVISVDSASGEGCDIKDQATVHCSDQHQRLPIHRSGRKCRERGDGLVAKW
jgi:subtilisin family serine protease